MDVAVPVSPAMVMLPEETHRFLFQSPAGVTGCGVGCIVHMGEEQPGSDLEHIKRNESIMSTQQEARPRAAQDSLTLDPPHWSIGILSSTTALRVEALISRRGSTEQMADEHIQKSLHTFAGL